MRVRTLDRTVTGTMLPQFLASGPCVEDWSDPARPADWFYAWRRWQVAMRLWGAEHGYNAPGLPLGPRRSPRTHSEGVEPRLPHRGRQRGTGRLL
jgi:hypothetical protein